MARVLTLALALVIPAAASAATITVDDSGGADYTTIQPAINASVTGDTVLVYEGTYTGPQNRALNFGGRNIVLESYDGFTTTNIDCEGQARAFQFSSGEDTTAVVRGFTIKNGHADAYGGAVYCDFGSGPIIEGCLFQTNAANYGGAIDCHSSSPIIRECVFVGNTAVFFAGAIQLWDSNARVAGCGFTSNSASRGGDMYCHGEHPEVFDCSFTGSSVTDEGGSLYLDGSAPAIVDCVFNGSSADNYGGAVSIWYGTPDFTFCQFIGCSSGFLGGAIDWRGSSGSMDDCLFRDCEAASGSAILCASASPLITWCTIIGGVQGTAVRCHNYSAPTIHHVTIASAHGGFYVDSNSTPEISNTVVAFSTVAGAFYCDGLSTPEITQCISYGNAGGDSLCGNYYDNLFVDPLFCDMEYSDLTNCANSPCLPANNAWGEFVGAHEGGCEACGSPAERASWGAIKALYR